MLIIADVSFPFPTVGFLSDLSGVGRLAKHLNRVQVSTENIQRSLGGRSSVVERRGQHDDNE
jgi:hypothetical protein